MKTPLLPWRSLLILSGGTSLGDDFDHQHAEWSEALSEYVAVDRGSSQVDYRGILKNRAGLDNYLARVAKSIVGGVPELDPVPTVGLFDQCLQRLYRKTYRRQLSR